MLLRGRELIGYKLWAEGQRVGTLKDVFVEAIGIHPIRYFVVDTGGWLSHNEVLLTPVCFLRFDRTEQAAHSNLTAAEVEKSPPVEADMPLSRQYEEKLHAYYGWNPYWTSTPDALRDLADTAGNSYLRSVKEMLGYAVSATDGNIGHVHDALLDVTFWRSSHLVIDTGNWLAGRQVVVETENVVEVNWRDERVSVALTRVAVREAPEYDSTLIVDDVYRKRLSHYYETISGQPTPGRRF